MSRRILIRRAIEGAALGVIVGGLLAAACQIVLWLLAQPHRGAGIMTLLAGLLGGVAVALIKGVSVRQAARYIDNRAGLDERLTTAVELADAGDTSPAACCVYAQGRDAAESRDVSAISLWVRGPVTGGAIILAVFLYAAAAMLPEYRTPGQQILHDLGDMSPEAVKALSGEFVRAAGQANADAPLLIRASKAVGQKDARALAAILDELKRSGVELVRIVRPEVLALATSGTGDGAGTATTQAADSNPDHRSAAAGGTVHVWDPMYAKFNPDRSPTTRGAGVDDPSSAVTYNDAWSAARLRAAGALRTGGVPSEYRAMVRQFFSDRK
jgi:hypothetical protein